MDSGSFDIKGKKIAIIFYYGPKLTVTTHQGEEDVNLICKTLKYLDFEILSEDILEDDDAMDCDDGEGSVSEEGSTSGSDEEMDQTEENVDKDSSPSSNDMVIKNKRQIDLEKFLKTVAERAKDCSCILLYFIAPQEGAEFKTHNGKTLALYDTWKTFVGIDCPVLFFIQAIITKNVSVPDVLYNTDNPPQDDKPIKPGAANRLLVYLPSCVGSKKTVAEVLNEELCKPYNINACLTQVIAKLNAMNCRPNPKFSSTLCNQLQLNRRENAAVEMSETLAYNMKRPCLVYAFLFAQFDNKDLIDLAAVLGPDRVKIEKTFTKPAYELEICVKESECMTVDQFHKTLEKIIGDTKKMESCDCIMIILSSHGWESEWVFAYDGPFRMEDVRHALSKCEALKGKPKVIIRDACRGGGYEAIQYDKSKKSTSKIFYDKDAAIPQGPDDAAKTSEYCEMTDVLVAMASTKGMQSYGSNCGSLFINELCKHVNNPKEEDILTALQVINETIASKVITMVKDKIEDLIQMPTFTSTLQKTLYLPCNKRKDLQS